MALNMSLQGRVALVTGASRGIGRGIALTLAQQGAQVAVNYRKDEAAADEVVAAIRAEGGKAEKYACSVDDLAQCESMIGKIVQDFGSLSILVNNAGVASRGKPVAQTEPSEMERLMRVHAFGPFYLTHLALPHLRAAPRGDVVMVSSTATTNFSKNGSPYNMAKAAAEAMAFTLAKEELHGNVRVNVVAPSLTATDMGERLMKARTGVDDMSDLAAKMAFGKVCAPEDVAAVVAWLVSDANTYVTGQKLNIDCGPDWMTAARK